MYYYNYKLYCIYIKMRNRDLNVYLYDLSISWMFTCHGWVWNVLPSVISRGSLYFCQGNTFCSVFDYISKGCSFYSFKTFLSYTYICMFFLQSLWCISRNYLFSKLLFTHLGSCERHTSIHYLYRLIPAVIGRGAREPPGQVASLSQCGHVIVR